MHKTTIAGLVVTLCLVGISRPASCQETGLVFIDGEFVAGPYQIQFEDERLLVNSVRIDLGVSTNVREHSSVDNLPPRPGRAFDRGRRDWVTPGYGEPYRPADRRGPGGNGNRQQPQGGRENNRYEDTVFDIRQALANDGVVVFFDNTRPFILSRESQKATLAGIMLGEEDTENAQVYNRLGVYRERDRWEKFLNAFKPDAMLIPRLQRMVEELAESEEANYSQIRALRRLENFSYPLTVLGMLLGAIALGHNLQWSASGIVGEQADRFLVKGLILIAGMSLLDLTWTIMSFQAGQMKEVNPFASSFIDSPIKLVLFKLAATSGACGILYVMRASSKIQQAAWWMCLVCVLLTFRWIMLNSFMA